MTSRFEEIREEYRREMKEFKSKLERDVRKELREFEKSLDNFNARFEEVLKKNETLQKENQELKKANDTLMTECTKIKKELEEQELRITANEQYSRNCNVEIKGVQESKSEDLVQTVCQIGISLQHKVEPDNIEVVHRVKTRNDQVPSNIVVRFKSRCKRDAFLQKAKKTRLTMHDLGHSSNEPIFVNEHLCPPLKRLLGMAIEKKRVSNWKFVRVKNGHIFARKDEDSRVVRVTCARDIDKIQ
ncbi:uncharacterized protein PF3D7_1120000-like [Dermacentor albipictus]|uniref:uncharacterized protein PF3D7_1120000-like n=1 Tax=Dermacentor albipictus TaxID=60249 RepID=UPI0038FC4AA5